MAGEVTKKKLRPARKQVKPGDVDLSEKVQPGKEYSELLACDVAYIRHLVQQVGRWRQGGRVG